MTGPPHNDDDDEISSISLKFLPGYVSNPITFLVTIDLKKELVTFKGKPGYGLDDVDDHYVLDREKIIQTSEAITKQKCQSLVKTLYEIDFFSLKGRYDQYGVTDSPYVTISVMTKSGKEKQVLFYGGHIADYDDKQRFYRLFDKIKELTDIDKWLSSTFDKNY